MKNQQLISKSDKKRIALLLDPDKYNAEKLKYTLGLANEATVDFIFVGGSLISKHIDQAVLEIKKHTSLPVILFPGSLLQLSAKADALLLLSLISGRNPEYLIGNHVIAAPFIRSLSLEAIPTGYMLIDTGNTSSVQYISNTMPIPSDKTDIITATALAGEMMGLRLIYLEAGSGAIAPLNPDIVREVKKTITIPLIVGGGIKNAKDASNLYKAGADVLVVGNAVENNPENLRQIATARFI